MGGFGSTAVTAAEADEECIDKAKNVIYIIGEGMGENLIEYTQWKYVSAYSELNMQQMSVSGLVSTYSADNGTSDDAAAGTQLATGSDTDNGIIGLGAELDNYRRYENLLEAAERNGKRTGIISDSDLTGSVAAAFLAHAESEDSEDITTQVNNAVADVKIANSKDLTEDLDDAIDSLAGGENGFVLVIDSAKIEDYAVANDAENAMSAVKDLDDAVKAALDFAKKDGETLVIVTAEHETGSIVETDLSSRSSGSDTITWLSNKPSFTNVVLFAEGRGAEHFNGYYHSTDICRKIAHITGMTDWDFYDAKTVYEPSTKIMEADEEVDILSYDFENVQDGSTVVEDVINDYDAELVGSGATIVYDESLGSNVLKLDNKSSDGSYLKLPRGSLDKLQYLTIEMDVKSDQTYDKNSSLFQIGASTSAYFYFKYEPLGEGLRYSLNPGSDWKSSGTQEITGIDGDTWVRLKYVVEPTSHTVYINDKKFLTYETKGSISMLGEYLYAYIGHSLFSNDKDYSGSVDNIKISGIRLNDSEDEDVRIKAGIIVSQAEPVTDENDLPEKSESDKAKNVIILIGDGTGQNILQLSQWYYDGADNPYTVYTMPYTGMSKTYSASAGVTDSAAAGTAMSSGIKTTNSYLGMDTSGVSVKNIMEYARENNMATGILTTTDLTDATPAAFSAHVTARSLRDEIAAQQAECGIDIFMGGGRTRYGDYVDAMKSDGYKYITSAKQMRSLGNDDKVIALFGESGDLEQPLDGDTTEPLLDEMVKKSIEMLDGRRDQGFVLMAEGATIDHYNHSNAVSGAVEQAKIFDNAVKEALEFAKEDGNTLVIVSADHETGGLGLLTSNSFDEITSLNGKYTYTTGNHSSSYVPIFAYGPGAERLTGVHENTEIFDVAMLSLGIKQAVDVDYLEKFGNEVIYSLTANKGGDYDVYCVSYGSDGHMIGFEKTSYSFEEGEVGQFSTTVEDCDNVGLYIWKQDTMEPSAYKAYTKDFSEEVLTSSKQNAAAFHTLPQNSDKVTYSFTLTDNGSNDSGIMIGNSSELNTTSSNYFASGSIVILFASGKIYTRDSSAKTKVATYDVDDSVKFRIEADVSANTYDLYVNDTLVAENVNFRTTIDTIDTLAMVENHSGENFNITDFVIE
jgi:alkaline phosphatase